jgi:peptidoglycan glycosyltransferase
LPNTQRELKNWSGTACGPGGVTTLQNALAIYCNTAFASIGLDLGDDALRAQAEKFGWGTSFEVPLRSAASRFPADPDLPQTAMSAIGQFDVTASALQMALVGAGIGNNGQVMSPYLVSQVLSPELDPLETAEPVEFSQAMSPANAAALLGMMVTVVDQGTGSNARIPGVSVGGKTGTAQTSPGQPPHAWFVGVAPAGVSGQAQVAVAVVLQNGGGAAEVSGNKLAAPIAKAVMEAVLRR